MIQRWKNIPGYDGKYQADTEGNIRRVYPSGKTRKMTAYHKKMSGSQRLVVKLTRDGKSKEEILMQIIARTFLGEPPAGCVAYHRNGCQSDNYIQNISYISRKKLGKLTGAKARRQPVAKLDSSGEVLEVYSSAREAGKKNYCSYQTVTDRCNGKVKAPLGNIDFAWEDSEISMNRAVRRLERKFGSSYPVAPQEEYEW